MKWQYRIARLRSRKSIYELGPIAIDEKGKRQELPISAGEFMADLGDEGWELVAVSHEHELSSSLFTLWFKRPAG